MVPTPANEPQTGGGFDPATRRPELSQAAVLAELLQAGNDGEQPSRR